MPEYSIVLLGRLAGKDIPVARAISDAFSQPVTWGEQIVTQSPITLLVGLRPGQTRQVKESLAGIEKIGCKFDVREGVDPNYPRITWQTECKLFDRPLSAYMTDADKRQPSVQTFAFVIPPSSVPLKIEIRVIPEMAAATVSSAPADVSGIDGSRPVAPERAAPTASLRPPSNADALGAPPPLTPEQKRLRDSVAAEPLPEITDFEDDEPVEMPSAPRLLPDVPLIPAPSAGPTVTPPANVRPAMRLEDFEAGFRDLAQPSSPIRVEPVDPPAGDAFASPRVLPQDTRLFDVTITACASPRAIQLLAKTLELDIPTAQKRAKRPVITVARNVSEQDANAIASEFERAGARANIKIAR